MQTVTTRTLTTDQVTVTARYGFREVLVIPDHIAQRMVAEAADGWIVRDGWENSESRWFTPGTWMYDTIRTLMQAYAASPVPDGVTDGDAHIARRDRAMSGHGLELWPTVVGASGWDAHTNDFTDDGSLRLHPGIHRVPGDDAYRIGG